MLGLPGPPPGGPLRARLYVPAGAGHADPLLVYFHGGGFVAGSLESHDGLCRLFAAEGGFKVIAVDYRLAPENPYPAAVEDAIRLLDRGSDPISRGNMVATGRVEIANSNL